VGAYFDEQLITMMEGSIKKEKGKNCNRNALEKVVVTALLNPTYPRTIRIVMNRALSGKKYNFVLFMFSCFSFSENVGTIIFSFLLLLLFYFHIVSELQYCCSGHLR